MKVVIDIPEEYYHFCKRCAVNMTTNPEQRIIASGTPLPKGHGRLIDISKIDEDRIESDNPIIYLTVNGEYIEAVSLDYLNNLQTIIEADKGEEE